MYLGIPNTCLLYGWRFAEIDVLSELFGYL